MPCAWGVKYVFGCTLTLLARNAYRRRTTLSIGNQEKPSPFLWYAEIGRIQHMLLVMVSQRLKLCLQLSVSRPRPHMDHIFHHDPARPQYLCKSDYLHGGGPASLRPRGRTLCAAMVRTLRRSQDEINRSNSRFEPAWLDRLKSIRDYFCCREVCRECAGCDAAHIDCSSDCYARLLRAAATAPRTGEEIESSQHGPPTARLTPNLFISHCNRGPQVFVSNIKSRKFDW